MRSSNGKCEARERWREIVVRRRRQLRAREEASGVDAESAAFRTYAAQLQADVRERPPSGLLMDMLRQHVRPDSVVLDVGAGPGRYTLPLARLAARVVAVEPSEQMADYLEENLAAAQIANAVVVRQRWQEADVPCADIVLCAHVLYDVEDVGSFVWRLDEHARRACFLLHHIGQYDPLLRALWQCVYDEERAPMPVVADLMPVLAELGLPASVAGTMAPTMRLSFRDIAEAVAYCTERMALRYDDTAIRHRVERYLRDLLLPMNGRLVAPPVEGVAVVWWAKGT